MKTRKIKIVIVDDEKGPADLLKTLLTRHPQIEILTIYNDPEIAIANIPTQKPDIVFLDIQMPKKDGFKVLDEISRVAGFDCEVVFTTAHEEFALKAFDYAAFGYLLKPIDPDKLAETIERYLKQHRERLSKKADKLLTALKKLVFRTQKGIIFIDPKDLVYCEADGNYTDLYFEKDRKETVSMNLGHIEQTLVEHGFYRISRSCIINLSCIKSVEKKKCHLEKSGETIVCEMSKDKIAQLVELLQL